MTDKYDIAIRNVATYAIPVGLLLWGMTSARARSVRRGANVWALRGLVFALGAWVVMLLEVAFSPMLPWQASLVFVPLVALLGVWAGVLGVGGLLRSGRLRSGVLPAVSATVIGLGLAGLMGWSTASGYMRGRQQTPTAAAPAGVADVGLRLAPPAEWTPVDPKQMNPNARLAYVRLEPTMALVIMADMAPPGQVFEVPAVVRHVRSTLAVPDSTHVQETPLAVGGRSGVVLGIDAAGPHGEFNYCVWLSATATHTVIALVSAKTAAATPAQVATEAERVFRTMEFH